MAEQTIDEILKDAPTGENTDADETAADEVKAESADSASPAEESEAVSETEKATKGKEAALLAERRRRQAAEERLREIESKRTEPDPDEDPEAFAQHHRQQAQRDKVMMSRELLMELHDDYEDMEQVFMGLVTDERGEVIDQGLAARMQAAQNPALFAYQHAKEHLEAEKYRDPTKRAELIDQWKEDWKKELRDELLAELKGEASKPSVPDLPDLTKATAAGPNGADLPPAATIKTIFEDSPL